MNIRDVNEVDKYLQENTFKLEEENIVVGTFSAAEEIVRSVNDLLLHDVSHSDKPMWDNMQYYMEFCQRNGYVTPREWIDNHKHF